jgi:3-dehydroquinate synthetase
MTKPVSPAKLTVTLNQASPTYPIVVQAGLLEQLGQALRNQLTMVQRVLLVTDEQVGALYLATAQNACVSADLTTQSLTLPAGEQAKGLENLTLVLQAAHQAGLKRGDALVALGGGVMGDMVGLAAALHYRGCGFVQVPTTLLAMVDSSVGGKVAVNSAWVKNSIGTFYHPHVVLMDTDLLNTLPQREWLAGLAEVAKYALLERSALGLTHANAPLAPAAAPLPYPELLPLWPWLLQHSQALAVGPQALPPTALASMILTCCALKAAVVRRDPNETAAHHDATGRVALNLGHTFAHAYEQALGYGTLLHGEAVALGLRLAVAASMRCGLLPADQGQAVLAGLDALGLYKRFPSAQTVSTASLVALLAHDKKVSQGQVRFILPTMPLGSVVVRDDLSAQHQHSPRA